MDILDDEILVIIDFLTFVKIKFQRVLQLVYNGNSVKVCLHCFKSDSEDHYCLRCYMLLDNLAARPSEP